jgi:hypothetical protein
MTRAINQFCLGELGNIPSGFFQMVGMVALQPWINT